jgi:acetate kinase
MIVPLRNAGYSSVKATLMESDDGRSLAKGAADRAGSATKYQYAGADGKSHAEEVSWKGHAAAVRRFVSDLHNANPIVLPRLSDLVAVGQLRSLNG